ncbi:hypothetical protein DVA67_005475 [Solirubrobacter sp. CPCC 204708]|uniref:Plastocyanin/azurin family copper-binding protein n=1 Tax=Solirubrobacter deserti TaxID=2282478 RepID=A0ABT4RGU1_9ACTN|nr:plastocyanin/azurin family copper-binding protein [Solirubrobacter deserti]MBE2315414.1 hypothetical protein [Solirubrobacter deserti]MDA0137744.1 plastocyanin/azurin family copper-binding protein [Solirubrobacter deserti]
MAQGKRRVVHAAIGVVLTGALVGSVGVAGAAEERAADELIGIAGETAWDKPNVSINTGDTVTWRWERAGQQHNVRGESGPETDPNWLKANSGFGNDGELEFTFTQPGSYRFICDAHASTMFGTVTVTGDPVEATPTPSGTPTGTPTPAPTVRPTVTPTPTPGMDRTTPAPVGAARGDTVAPVISRIKLKAVKRGAKVSFSLSETANVTVRVKKGKSSVKTIRLSARSGARSLTVRGLTGGSYRFELQARDARGNQAAVQRKSVKVKR